MATAAKLGIAAGVAALGVGAAVYSAWSLQRRPTSPPPRAAMMGQGGSGGPRAGGERPGGNVEVKMGAEAAQRLGLTEEELNAKAKELLAQGVKPEDLGRELGLGDAPVHLERRAEGGPGGGQGAGEDGPPEMEPAPVGPFEFVRADSAVSTAKVEGLLETAAEEAGRGAAGLDAGRGDPGDVARAARLALVGPAAGKAAFAEAVRALGGQLGTDGGLTGSAAGLAEMLEGAQLDPTKVRVRGVEAEEEAPMLRPRTPAPPPDGGDGGEGGSAMRMMMSIMRDQSGDGPARELATMSIPVSDVWPDTADEVEDGVIAVEARVPARLKNLDVEDGRAEIGVVMVRERGSRVWQPVKYNVYVWDGKAARTFARAIREARRGG